MNFELILFLLALFTGAFWLAERLVWKPKRAPGLPRPAWLEYTAGFFPVVGLVFLVRSFLFEPFNIPSGSMLPTLRIGDLILVQKYAYGIRLPVARTQLIATGLPERGDVVVFRYPKDPSVDYIKRVVGLPGDLVVYENKRLTINGQAVSRTALPAERLPNGQLLERHQEVLGSKRVTTYTDPNAPASIGQEAHPYRDNCQVTGQGYRCRVPQGHYFVMGDNRDNSADSRVWGFLPEANLAGKAFLVWFNASEVFSGDLSRLGRFE